MLKTTRLAMGLALGLSAAPPALAQSEPAQEAAPAAQEEYKKYKGIRSQAELEEKRARLEKKRAEMRERRERRMKQQVEKLRQRAERLRRDAAKKDNPIDRDTLEAQAKRIEEKAMTMEERQRRFREASVQARAAVASDGETSGPGATLTREQRSKIRKAQVRRRWGQILGRPEVTEELRTHALRTARLRRVRALAKEQNETELVKRANQVIAKEQQRHLTLMQKFEKGEAAPAPNEPASLPPKAVEPAGGAPTPAEPEPEKSAAEESEVEQ